MNRKRICNNEWHELIETERDKCKTFTGKVRVDVSGGAGSAIAWKRCLDWYGADRVVPVFADTKTEHEDLYRFLADLEQAFGQKIERLADGRDIWDVFLKSKMIKVMNAGGACKASIELKQKPLAKHFEESDCDAIAVGLEATEAERIKAFRDKIGHVIFPLVATPMLSDCEIKDEITKLGIELPALYADNYTHNNCGGFCVLAGLGQWAQNYKRDPETFAAMEKRENEFMQLTDGFTVLRKTTNGITQAYPLHQLREDVESGVKFPQDWKSNCSCMTPKLFSLDDCF